MRSLLMAMLACLCLRAELGIAKHVDSSIAVTANRLELTRHMSIIDLEKYKHKSEVEIARMTPAQRVNEYAEEHAHHKYDVLDDHSQLIEKYIWRDGIQALPRLIEIIDEYDPTRASGRRGHKGERFDAMWMLLGDLDNHVMRLRGAEAGRRAIDALERAIKRMRSAGYGRKDQHTWAEHGRYELAVTHLQEARGINLTDRAIRDTFRLEYKILLSAEELLAFSNFLALRYPEYPGWSDNNFIKDHTQINDAGNPLQIYTMKNPRPFHEAYLEFKKRHLP